MKASRRRISRSSNSDIWLKLKQHIACWRENYVLLPLAISLLYGAIHGVHRLTGRAIVDDPGAIVGMLYNFIGLVFAVMLAGFVKPLLFDDIDTREPGTTLGRAILDSCETFALLLVFVWFLVGH
jgi:hypothetical protein